MSESNNVKNSTEEINSKIFDFIYYEAMDDATKQQSYKGKKAWLKDNKNFEESTRKLKAFVDKTLSGEYKDDKDKAQYDNDFIVVAKILCKEINDRAEELDLKPKEDSFTFGNAQKLINMIMKHYYTRVYNNNELRKLFQHCHCPMDCKLLEKVWIKQKDSLLKESWTQKSFNKPWGSEDFHNLGDSSFPERYCAFQKAVKNLAGDLSPLEYDYKEWM